MSQPLQFILNQHDVVSHHSPGLLVLDYLRKHARLVGTKEGCKEGDCGACMVLVGEVSDDQLRYQPVTSCLMPLGALHGKHLVTIEGLNLPEDLSPVQRAIVEEGGTQCGYCTPGIVVSLTGWLMSDPRPLDERNLKYALSGNLCRCTGYRSLKNCASVLRQQVDRPAAECLPGLVRTGALPKYFLEIPQRLRRLSTLRPVGGNGSTAAIRIAGGTDLYVQRGDRLTDSPVDILTLRRELKGIRRTDGHFHIGALTTFEEFGHHPDFQRIMPQLGHYLHLMASWQIRNRATLGGNLINASPIADMTNLLLVLNTELVLQRGQQRRTVPLRKFYVDYKRMDKRDDEILTEIVFPEPTPGTRIHWEKVSKRKCLDIATVNSAARFRVEGNMIVDAAISLGGVAAVPLFLEETSALLIGRPLNVETVLAANDTAQQEFTPISDVRGSADYRRLLARQLLLAHFIQLFPDTFKLEMFF